jgi:type IV pilus assembly protein PilY1
MMISNRFGGLSVAILAWMFVVSGSAHATSDTDIALFSGAGKLAPNIMIVLDSSASMRAETCGGCDSKIDVAADALTNLIEGINPLDTSTADPTDRIENARFGLMTYRYRGGQLEYEIKPGNTDAVVAAIDAETAPDYFTTISTTMIDAARYFGEHHDIWPNLPAWGDYDSSSSTSDDEEPGDITYDPFQNACRDTHLVLMTDGLATNDQVNVDGFLADIGDADGDGGVGEWGRFNTSDYTESSDIANGIEKRACENVDGNGIYHDCMQWGDDVAYKMYRTDFNPDVDETQNVITHVVGFAIDHPSLERIAAASGSEGIYKTASNAAQLETTLTEIFADAMDAVATYSAAAVPSSRTSTGSIFVNAFFEPVRNTAPWEGHLEMWGLASNGTILAGDTTAAVDSDGAFIDGKTPHWDAAAAIKTNATRKIYTNITVSGVTTQRELSDDTNVTNVELGVAVADREDLVLWTYGKDSYNGNDTTYRDIVLADIFHSTPAVVGAPTRLLLKDTRDNSYVAYYAAHYDRDRLIYVGANDGMLHAFDAGVWVDPVGTTPGYYTTGDGQEVFGYVPEHMLMTLRDFPSNTEHSVWGVDGSPTVADVWLPTEPSTADFLTDASRESSEWETVLIVGDRKGGQGYLALEITDADNAPNFMWEFMDAGLGETWSKPVITRVKVQSGTISGDKCGANNGENGCTERWVAIFGGGYEAQADPNNAVAWKDYGDAGFDARARSVYMVDIATGNVLAELSHDNADTSLSRMKYAFPSPPGVLDLDFDGFADVVYIGDAGGQMWKWDISAIGVDSGIDNIVDNWRGTVFFDRPPVTISSVDYYFPMYAPPTAVYVGGRLFLVFGTGNRSDLLELGDDTDPADNNRLYVIRDDDPTDWYTPPIGLDPEIYPTARTESSLEDITSIAYRTDPTKIGYYIVGEEGEKWVSDARIFAGYVVMSSYQGTPPATTCGSSSGRSYLYAFRVKSGAGYWDPSASAIVDQRRIELGDGLAAAPDHSMGQDPDDDKIFVKTSKGLIKTLEAPPRTDSGASVIYWRQNF